jgi:hypothetical protein
MSSKLLVAVEVFEKVCGAPKKALFKITTTLAGQLFSPLFYNVAGLLDGPAVADFLHTLNLSEYAKPQMF